MTFRDPSLHTGVLACWWLTRGMMLPLPGLHLACRQTEDSTATSALHHCRGPQKLHLIVCAADMVCNAQTSLKGLGCPQEPHRRSLSWVQTPTSSSPPRAPPHPASGGGSVPQPSRARCSRGRFLLALGAPWRAGLLLLGLLRPLVAAPGDPAPLDPPKPKPDPNPN